jgi:hypothetical protein
MYCGFPDLTHQSQCLGFLLFGALYGNGIATREGVREVKSPNNIIPVSEIEDIGRRRV